MQGCDASIAANSNVTAKWNKGSQRNNKHKKTSFRWCLRTNHKNFRVAAVIANYRKNPSWIFKACGKVFPQPAGRNFCTHQWPGNGLVWRGMERCEFKNLVILLIHCMASIVVFLWVSVYVIFFIFILMSIRLASTSLSSWKTLANSADPLISRWNNFPFR